MQLYELNSAFSIIYHDENTVEFRSGVWNVTSHHLSDDNKGGILARIILAIEESNPCDITSISKKTDTRQNDCANIFDALIEEDLLLAFQKKNEKDYPQGNVSKILMLGDVEMSNTCQDYLSNQFSQLTMDFIPYSELDFIDRSGQLIELDALALEKTVEHCRKRFEKTLVVVLDQSVNPVFYLSLNKVLHASHIPWFLTAIDGPFVYVGPLFNDLFCYECLDHRVLMTAKSSANYQIYKNAVVKNLISLGQSAIDPSLKALALSLASIEISNFLTTGRSWASQKLLSIYIPTMEFSYHKVLRLPGCNVCGVDNALEGHQIHFDTGVLLPS